MINEKKIIVIARSLSLLFTPFYLPIVGMIALFSFTYLSFLTWSYKLQIIVATYLFTILMPTILIHAYRRYHGWSLYHLREREKRMVPYIISILSYLTCFYLMTTVHTPHFMSAVIVAALIVQIACAFTNIWFKVSTHTAGIGGFIGGLIAYSFILGFNPVWWMSILILLAGAVGSARMILRIHSLHQVVAGFFVGLVSAFLIIIWI